MEQIKYIKGDATRPIGDGNKLIVHCCNNIGAWGLGFVLALNKRWKEPHDAYIAWSEDKSLFKLGEVQFVEVEKDIVVANMIGQHGIGSYGDKKPIRYDAIDEGLQKISKFALEHNYSIHAPKFGSGLAGGDWKVIEELIIDNLCENNIPVTIYTFN
jgi:O-acetyl-ADP-ribose deacetylase (regulator of RNase III)